MPRRNATSRNMLAATPPYRACVVCGEPLRANHKCSPAALAAYDRRLRRLDGDDRPPTLDDRLADGFDLLAANGDDE